MQTYYLSFTESAGDDPFSYTIFTCHLLRRHKTRYVDELALVKIDPPLDGREFTLDINPLRHLILMARHQGCFLFPIPGPDPQKGIGVNIFWTKDLKIPTADYVDPDNLLHISVGVVFLAPADIKENLGFSPKDSHNRLYFEKVLKEPAGQRRSNAAQILAMHGDHQSLALLKEAYQSEKDEEVKKTIASSI